MSKSKYYTEEDRASWPDGHKRCADCRSLLPFSAFSKNHKSVLGLSNKCRGCALPVGNVGFTRFTLEEEMSWPAEHRGCIECRLVKPFSEFHAHSGCRWGVNTVCKECRLPKSKKHYANQKLDTQKLLWSRAKGRATKNGIAFNIDIEDVVVPDVCPIFGTKFVFGDHHLAPSLDRIRPELGYVKGNVIVISNKANIIKNNATPEEISAVGQFFTNLI